MKPAEDWRARIPAERPRRKEVRLWRLERIWLVGVSRSRLDWGWETMGGVPGCCVGRILGPVG